MPTGLNPKCQNQKTNSLSEEIYCWLQDTKLNLAIPAPQQILLSTQQNPKAQNENCLGFFLRRGSISVSMQTPERLISVGTIFVLTLRPF